MNTRIIDTSWHPLITGCPPHWASGWGQDRWGVFVEITLQEVTQRLRWIPPGRFWMGSPEGEPGRDDDEGPRHLVTLSDGYWLFDTPCTQALWEAVMGKNPSRFQDPTRPVEQVSWNDVQAFLKRANEQIPGLNLSLPSEAQWEYACRAGTETAIYTGDLDILGDFDAPALDPIAWYSGNSESGTHSVKLKCANPWGLYDLLGNVLEWTQDDWHGNYQGAPSDGSAWLSDGADITRVLRGGSWDDGARDVRAAYRYDNVPGHRYDLIGFRCARTWGEPS
ncbi:MAG: formylglycine-generating enzyme family protein [Phycisphaerales bacterium]|nr:formylglycine-generating enzyme family protein [Phycisphaerales bacterium]